MLTACEESEDEENEFADWKNRNELFFNNQYTNAKERIGQGDDSWRLYLKWSFNESQGHTQKDYIIVKVLEEGNKDISPLYTDQVEVFIQGKLIPSNTFPNGYIFYNSYNDNNMNPNTASSVWMSADGEDYALSGNKGRYVDGLATALMHMHLALFSTRLTRSQCCSGWQHTAQNYPSLALTTLVYCRPIQWNGLLVKYSLVLCPRSAQTTHLSACLSPYSRRGQQNIDAVSIYCSPD